jgi:hypothetical protein
MSAKVLNIFDFDSTLVDTQIPETGKAIWLEKTGKKWPHIGWWSKPESLDCEVFEQPVIEAVIEEYKSLSSKPNSHNIMLTGRRTKLHKEVEAILEKHKLVFDEYRYNYGGDTLTNKIEQIADVLSKNKPIDHVNMFEDRIEHIVTFKQYFESMVGNGFIKSFQINHVIGETIKII